MSLALEGRGAGRLSLSIPSIGNIFRTIGGLLARPQIVALVSAAALWEGAVRFFALPLWYLPAPSHVAATLWRNFHLILPNAGVTAAETLIGLAVGVAIGMALALAMSTSRWLADALGPLAVVSQAIPFMALAPLMMIWFGFGIASKIAMAAITIFFSVAAAYYEGLRRADENLIELAKLYGATPLQILREIRMPAARPHLAAGLKLAAAYYEGLRRADENLIELARLYGATPLQILREIRMPAARPHLAAGLKLAAAYAPLGAIAGEWVGSEGGLGIMMTYHNARMQTDMVFAAMAVLILFCLSTWLMMALFARHLTRHFPDTLDRRSA